MTGDEGSLKLAEIGALRRGGVIGADQFIDAAYACRDAPYWNRWSLHALLALGTGHLLAGVVFFFAFNWNDLPALGKFALLQGGVLISVAGALIARVDRPSGQVLLIAATILSGTLIAVVGQVYQTGADAWQLFATWALITVPWVVASRGSAHWLVWLVIAFIAANLYGFQVLIANEILTLVQLSCLIALATGLVLVAREVLVGSGAAWLDRRWTRILPALLAPLIVFSETMAFVFGQDQNLVAAITFVGLLVSLAGVYLRWLPDFAAVAIATGFASLLLMAVGVRVLQETMPFDWDNAFQLLVSLLLLTLWCAAVTTGTVKLLARLRRRVKKRDD